MTHSLEQHPRQRDQWRFVEGSKVIGAWSARATARRLMACWRACEGIETEDLEKLALAKTLDKKLKV